MFIHEITIQDLEGLPSAVTARPRPCEHTKNSVVVPMAIELTNGFQPTWFYALVRSMFYPGTESQRIQQLYVNGKDPKAHVLFVERGAQLLLQRGRDPESIFVQAALSSPGSQQPQWKSLASGQSNCNSILEQQFSRPSQAVFDFLVNWTQSSSFYMPSAEEEAIEQMVDGDLSINSLMRMYQKANTFEHAEARVRHISQQLMSREVAAVKARNPQFEINSRHKAALESEIESLYAQIANLRIGDIPQQQFLDAENAQRRLEKTAQDIKKREADLLVIEERLRTSHRRPWFVSPFFWLSFIAGLACLLPLPWLPPRFVPIALISIPLVSIAAWIAFRSSGHSAQLADVATKLDKAEEELARQTNLFAEDSQTVEHFLTSMNVRNMEIAKEKFDSKNEMVRSLAVLQSQLEDFLSSMSPEELKLLPSSSRNVIANPNHTLVRDLEVAKKQLQHTDKPAYSAQAIANSMKVRGVDPSPIAQNHPETIELQAREKLLLDLCQSLGIIQNGQLLPDVETLWNQLLHHFMHQNLHFCVQNHAIQISESKSSKPSSPNWKFERRNVLRWVLFSLNCALLEFLTREQSHVSAPVNTIIALHPDSLERLDDRFRLNAIISATSSLSWVLLKSVN